MLRLDEQLYGQYDEIPPAVVTTWENREAILQMMRDAAGLSQRLQRLWERSGSVGRLSQDHTDEMALLLARLGDLGSALQRLD